MENEEAPYSIYFSIAMLKVILALSILALGLLSVFAPRRLTGAPAIFSLGNMTASGVLLSAGLVHQLSDSAQVLNRPDAFPWAMFVAGLTFLLFLVVEESLHLLMSGGYTDEASGSALNLHEIMHGGGSMGDLHHNHSHGHHRHYDGSDSKTNNKNDDKDGHRAHPSKQRLPAEDALKRPPPELQPLLRQSICTSTTIDSCSRTSISCSAMTLTVDNGNNGLSSSSSKDKATPTSNGSTSFRRPSQFGSFLQSDKSHKEDPFMLSEHHHHGDHIDLHLHGSIVASGILMLALSVHSILAGISIGIETKPDTITGTAIAILAHKSFEGFCLGSSLVNAQMDHVPFLVLGISFSCATPLGIVLGQLLMMGLEGDNSNGGGGGGGASSGETTIAVVQAIVAGTFLYISIVEIGTKELLVCRETVDTDENSSSNDGSAEDARTKMQRQKRIEIGKLVCFTIGFLAMSALAAIV